MTKIKPNRYLPRLPYIVGTKGSETLDILGPFTSSDNCLYCGFMPHYNSVPSVGKMKFLLTWKMKLTWRKLTLQQCTLPRNLGELTSDLIARWSQRTIVSLSMLYAFRNFYSFFNLMNFFGHLYLSVRPETIISCRPPR